MEYTTQKWSLIWKTEMPDLWHWQSSVFFFLFFVFFAVKINSSFYEYSLVSLYPFSCMSWLKFSNEEAFCPSVELFNDRRSVILKETILVKSVTKLSSCSSFLCSHFLWGYLSIYFTSIGTCSTWATATKFTFPSYFTVSRSISTNFWSKL